MDWSQPRLISLCVVLGSKSISRGEQNTLLSSAFLSSTSQNLCFCELCLSLISSSSVFTLTPPRWTAGRPWTSLLAVIASHRCSSEMPIISQVTTAEKGLYGAGDTRRHLQLLCRPIDGPSYWNVTDTERGTVLLWDTFSVMRSKACDISQVAGITISKKKKGLLPVCSSVKACSEGARTHKCHSETARVHPSNPEISHGSER